MLQVSPLLSLSSLSPLPTKKYAGSNFGTAKDLTEEIKSLISEKEELEGLLSELLVLDARNIWKLERIKDDYNKLKQELEHGETAFGK